MHIINDRHEYKASCILYNTNKHGCNVLSSYYKYKKDSSIEGFTLIELVMVLGIIFMLIAIGISSYLDWGRVSSLRASALMTQSGLNAAREWAVSYNHPVYFSCTNADTPLRGIYTMYVNDELIGHTNFLSDGVIFSTDSLAVIKFNIDGTYESFYVDETNDSFDIILMEAGKSAHAGLAITLSVSRISGYTRILQ